MKGTRKKPSLTVVLFGTVTAAMAVLVIVISAVFISSVFSAVKRREETEVAMNANVARSIMTYNTANSRKITREWATRSDVKDFIRTRNTTYPVQTLRSFPFYLYGESFLCIEDKEQEVLYFRIFESSQRTVVKQNSEKEELVDPIVSAVAKKFDINMPEFDKQAIEQHGFFDFNGKCYYVCAQPVLSDDPTAALMGYFVYGFIADSSLLAVSSADRDLLFTLLPMDDPDLQNLTFENGEAHAFTDNTGSYYVQLLDIYDEPVYVLEVMELRNLKSEGMATVIQTILTAGILLAAATVFVISLFWSRLIRPLNRFNSALAGIRADTFSIPADVYRSRELYDMAVSVNDMLERLRQSREEIKESADTLTILRNMLDSLDAYIYVSDPNDDTILFINEKMLKHFGIEKDTVGQPCWRVLQDGFTGRCDFCPVNKLNADSDGVVTWEEHNTVTGRHYMNADRFIKWTDGRDVHIQHSTDVTDLKKVEASLIEARDRAEKNSQAKSEFLSRMSHEMRTPMNAIIGMTKIAMGAEDQARVAYCLERIDNASRHLLGVINDILDMSKIEANKLELTDTTFMFEKMLMNVMDVVGFKADEKRQELIVHVDSGVPRSLVGDDQRLAQVITNLLSNAVKFSPEGGKISLSVKPEREDGEDVTLRFDITDDGIGISPEQQARLFRSFEQADGGISRRFGGTGLGLAISKRIVELMGGSIWVVSEEGEGSTFSFSVTMKRGPETPLAEAKPYDRGALRILVVDDAAEIREYFRHIMAEMGFNCDAAEDGAEALKLIAQNEAAPYDIFFLDWMMPGMNGVELARKIKETSSGGVVIMISSADWSSIEPEAAEAGISAFVPKPLFPSAVLDAIDAIIAGAPEAGEADVLSETADFSGHTILLAEDVDINREVISAMLEDTGIIIDYAENGTEAVKLFTNAPGRYSLIFMDIHMPETDGFEATRQIRALSCAKAKAVPIIAMTANVFKEDIDKCLAVGMNGHIGKPVDFDAVVARLREYLK